MKPIEIFPWNDHFNTGLDEVDTQHRVLVRLLNELASHIVSVTDVPDLKRVLSALTDYANYHFTAEEAVWDQHIPDGQEREEHRRTHQHFVTTMERLSREQATKPLAEVVDETLTYLARWLASHILEQDRYCAILVHALQAGQTPDAARAQAAAAMNGRSHVLIELLLSIYNSLTANTVRLLRENAERRRVQASLRESEARFRMIVERSPLGILLARDEKVLDVNDAAARIFGHEDGAALCGRPIIDCIAPSYRSDVVQRHRRRIQSGEGEAHYETMGLRRDGSEFPMVLSPVAVPLADGPAVATFILDISERQRAEKMERALTRTVKLLSRTNSLLVRVNDEQTLLEGVCRLAVDVGGYLMAWVGYAEQDGAKSVRPVAQYGYEQGYVQSAHISWGDNSRGHGPTGVAIRTGKRALSRDIERTAEMAPWRDEAVRRGYKAAVALPLEVDDEVIGALLIYSASLDPFTADELKLLDELAYDLAFGIQSLRLRDAKEAALRELKRESDKGRALLHNASDGVHVLDENGYLVEGSDSFFAMLGYTRAELMGKHMTTWHVGDESEAELARAYQEVLNSNTRQEFQIRHRRRDGSIIDVSVSTFPLTIEGRRVVFNSSRDITESLRIRTQLEQTTQDLRHLLVDFDSTLEAERTHIAREVHDELGQVLTSLGFAISTIRVKYGQDNPELMRIVREMSALNDRALQVTRNVAENLRPAALSMGIVAAIEWLCDKTRAQTGMNCRFRASGELDDMDPAQVAAVFRITQESLTNAMRHAQAGEVTVSLALREDGLHMAIHDDGKGFDTDGEGKPRSFGMLGMEERVRSLGGELWVTSAPDEGTTVTVHVPHQKREKAA